MTLEMWLAAAIGVVVGAAGMALVVALMKRRASDEGGNTTIPHRTREVLSALQSGSIVVRRDRRAAFSNHTASALGVTRPDGALHPGVADLAEVAWAAEQVVEDEVEVSRGVLGASSIVHVRVTPLSNDLALAIANDNTEMRAAEQTRREFAVNVSHELKTPVGALSLLAEAIEGNADDTEMVEDFAKKIRREARRLTKLIQEIIEISRIQGGESVIDHEVVPLAEVVEEVVEAAQVSAEARDVTVVADVSASPTVMGDHDLLVMALRNLVDNAINYSDRGSHVTVTLARDADTDVAVLKVIDAGIGISTENQERIFERFFRADPARSRETGGTGLGLSIVKHVVLQHSGVVEVWSKPTVGSTFTVRLTIHQEEQ
ncbi:sensor histidine kinase [Demequina sediminicola]|uniref:sensor histidine kinase n=1 Tax=Demequina sediminicola TaxID=1095026 RepID=UPI00078079D9|nr:ATP-binding protein [Demequina sediminicola]